MNHLRVANYHQEFYRPRYDIVNGDLVEISAPELASLTATKGYVSVLTPRSVDATPATPVRPN